MGEIGRISPSFVPVYGVLLFAHLILSEIHISCSSHYPAHQDVAENVFGFSRVYPGFRVIGNPGTGNPETGVFGGFRS